jgi:hypothetical protein
MPDLRGLPAAELVEQGLEDLAAGRESVAALVVAAAGARLRRLGLPVPAGIEEAELRLYRVLERGDPWSAYSRYNALLREVVSFARALEREEGAAIRAARGSRRRRGDAWEERRGVARPGRLGRAVPGCSHGAVSGDLASRPRRPLLHSCRQ